MKTKKTISIFLLIFCSFGTCFSQNDSVRKESYDVEVGKDSIMFFSEKKNSQLYNVFKKTFGHEDICYEADCPHIRITVYCAFSRNGILESFYIKSSIGYLGRTFEEEVKKAFNSIYKIRFNGIKLTNKKMTVRFDYSFSIDSEFSSFGFILKSD